MITPKHAKPNSEGGSALNQRSNQRISATHGYVAFASVLVICAVILVIGISVSLLSISEGQMSLAEKKKEETIDFVEACVEDALLRFNENNTIPSQIPLPQGTCDVTIDSQNGTWTFTVSGAFEKYQKKIQVTAERGTTVNVTSWKEVE